MKILYGVCGVGMGHVMRSAVVARYLESRGHAVRFASTGRALDYLVQRWPGQVTGVPGLATIITDNSVAPEATLLFNMMMQPLCVPLHVLSLLDVGFDPPDVVVTDFDPWTARYARLTGTPLVAVDNIHFANRCVHPPQVVVGDLDAAAVMFPALENIVPGAHRYLVTTFVDAPVCKPNTTLHLPILRPEVLRAKGARPNAYVVAYLNDMADHRGCAATLGQLGVPVRLYGEKGRTTETTVGNVTLCPFSDARFIADVAASGAVIGGAGFTFMTEAIYLGRPMLAVPFRGQFEQILNANYLEALGYGERACDLDPDRVSAFLSRVPAYTAELRGFAHDGNRELLAAVEAAIGAAR